MNTDIVAFGAHPDDVELGCSGTLASLSRSGKRVAVVDLTKGEMGSRGTPEKRLNEAQKAADILGLSERINLHLPDTRLENNRDHQMSVIQVIRRLRPTLCLMNAPGDRHPDHNMATRLVRDALFYSGLSKIESVGEDGEHQEPFRPSHQLYYMLHRTFEPDFVFDITDTIELKLEAIQAFSSQFNVKEPGEEPDTYISDPAFFDSMKARARLFGQPCGFDFGEPFKYVQKPVPLRDFNLFTDQSVKR